MFQQPKMMGYNGCLAGSTILGVKLGNNDSLPSSSTTRVATITPGVEELATSACLLATTSLVNKIPSNQCGCQGTRQPSVVAELIAACRVAIQPKWLPTLGNN
ncbi:Uncharacterized protein Fot_22386 [Forsythia ovata]|uniref:Uncharacterized protein n=1 Tax=Forsythia ovata TaxID=205694 RepID=A0ABD1UXK2_9LAMI